MRDQPTGSDLAEQDRQTQRLILGLMVGEDVQPWSIEELLRELGNRSELAIADALTRLHGVGLINQVDKLAFPSHAASYVDYLGMFCI